MLRIVNLEELESLLGTVPDLVRRQEDSAPRFVTDVKAWLAALEQVFAANRLHELALLATIRSTLVAIEQGAVPERLTLRGHPTRRRLLRAAAAEALQRAVELVTHRLQREQQRLEEAERIGHQIVALASGRGLVLPNPGGMGHTQYLRALRQVFSSTPELGSAITHLEGLVGPGDALIVLDRALTARRAPHPALA